MKHIGIICAMPVEIAPFTQALEITDDGWNGAVRFWQGTYADKQITLVQSGVGKVFAAAAAQMVLTQFAPEALFSCGTAGSLDPHAQIGAIIVGAQTVQHDYGFLTPQALIHFGCQFRRPDHAAEFSKEFPANPELLRLAQTLKAPETDGWPICCGTIVSGDQVILATEKRQGLAEQFHALAVDMESAALAQVAYMHAAPFLAIRGISDHADELLPIDPAQLDPNEFGGYAAATRGEKISLLTKALKYFAQHPAAFALSYQARRNIKKAARRAAAFTLQLIRSLPD